MDIAALSVALSQTKIQQQAGLSVMKMAMNLAEDNMDNMVQTLHQITTALEQAAQPHLGASIDILI